MMGRFGYEKDITNCIITECWVGLLQ